MSDLMNGDTRRICFTWICYPPYTVFRTLVKSNAAQPVVHNQMILYIVAPNNRVFKLSFQWRINAFVSNLILGRKAGFAKPNTTTPANHQVRSIFALRKCQVRKAFNNFTVTRVEIEFIFCPGAIMIIGFIVGINNINDQVAILSSKDFGIMARPYRISDYKRPDGIITCCMINSGFRPKSMASR